MDDLSLDSSPDSFGEDEQAQYQKYVSQSQANKNKSKSHMKNQKLKFKSSSQVFFESLLTFDNIYAFKIQNAWRRHRIRRRRRLKEEEHETKPTLSIVIYGSSFSANFR